MKGIHQNTVAATEKALNLCIVMPVFNEAGTLGSLLRVAKYNVRYLRSDSRHGYGASIKRGINNASADLICIIDGDNTYYADDISRLYAARDGHDIVIGRRCPDHGGVFPFHQRLAKMMIKTGVRIMFNLNIPDINSGLILARKDIVEQYKDVLSDGFSFSAGLTLLTLLHRRKVAFIPIKYKPRGNKSKVNVLQYMVTFIRSYYKVIHYYLCRKG